MGEPDAKGTVVARFRHVALYVPDLREAEELYVGLFGMTVLLRETLVDREQSQGAWATLPVDREWKDAEAAGVSLGMVALQRDDMVLALFAGTPSGRQIHVLGVLIDEAAIDEIAGRLQPGALRSHRHGYLEFTDRYGICWQLSSRSPFRSSGEMLGRWIDMGKT